MSENKTEVKQVEEQKESMIEFENTRKINDQNENKIINGGFSSKQPVLPPISYLSLRERYENCCEKFPLPLKFSQLLKTMRSIETAYWKKRKPITYEIKSQPFKIIQIGQLLKLDKNLYEVKEYENGIQIIPYDIPMENLPEYKENQKKLPDIFEERIIKINNKLDKLVQEAHRTYLYFISKEDCETQYAQFKMYYPEFNLCWVDDIEPLSLKFKIYSEEDKKFYYNIIEILIQYYKRRSVSNMFFINVINQLQLKLKEPKEHLEKALHLLSKIQPDFIEINNTRDYQKSRWIVHLNNTCLPEQQIQSLSAYLQ